MKMIPYSRILAYVLPNLGFFLLSSLGYFLFAISQVGIADWFRQIVDYISQPDSSLNLYLLILLFVLDFGRGIGFFVGTFFDEPKHFSIFLIEEIIRYSSSGSKLAL